MASLGFLGAALTAVVVISASVAHVCVWSLCGLFGF
jgi:hypothetical protein